MRIRRIKLSGFKSFVEPTELHVAPGLTGIVGPNGCGKSNLLEAIRWVMGESSAKSMRGGGMEDVIFAGTASRPARDFAEVALLAERTAEEIEKSPYDDKESELEVIRRIERGAGSAYRANGRDVRAKDIALIFADAATGAHSPALVSQGKIASVISAKPVERRMMLEEAAGIAGLHVRRKDAEQKLRAAEANLARLADIVADMDARANQLRRQARAAERYTRLTGEIRQAEARMVFARWRDARNAADAARKEADAAAAQVSMAQAAQEEASHAQQAATLTLAQQRAAHAIAKEESALCAQRLITAENEARRIDERIKELQLQQQRLEEDSGREDRLTRDATQALSRLREEVSKLAPQIATQEQRRPALERDLVTAEATVRENEVLLARAMAEQARVQADLKIADNALTTARQQMERIVLQRERSEAQRVALGDQSLLVETQAQATALRQAAEAECTAAVNALSEQESKREQAVEERDAALQLLASARAELSGITAEVAALEREQAKSGDAEEALSQMQVMAGYEAALAAALGDDAHASVGANVSRGWVGTAGVAADGPAGPAEAQCLADHVRAPSALLARLRQIWVVDIDNGQTLATGQRLVTRNGHMRRWDGFISTNDGAVAAERLKRDNRLAELRSVLPEKERAAAFALAASQNTTDALTASDVALRNLRQIRTQAEEKLRQAVRSADQADHALTRFLGDSQAITERLHDMLAEHDSASHALASAHEARAALPDAEQSTNRVETLNADGEISRQLVLRAHAALSDLDQRIAHDRERRAVAQAEVRGWQARAGEAEQRLAAMQERAQAISTELQDLVDKPAELLRSIASLRDLHAQGQTQLADLVRAEQTGEAELRNIEARLRTTGETLARAREMRAGAEVRAENQDSRRVEMARISGERFECPPPLLPDRLNFDETGIGDAQSESNRHEQLQADRERIGPVNLIAAEELATVENEQATSRAESEELQQAINRLRGSIGSLNREGRQRLLAAFEQVDAHFQRLFATLFNGGKAHLELVESDDPLEAGLEILAQPPGKRLTTLTLLSGGEQALTAIALIFGLFLTNPAPICVLDEVDAPLDDANIERFCDLLDTMVRETDTRYLIVTHNAVTMSRMHRLFGVTMIEQGISRLVSVDLGGAEELLAAE